MSAITSADGFHHLVYSISGTTHTLFLDNSAVSVNTNGIDVFSAFPNISNLLFGTASDLSYGYTGYIDDFKLYNRTLTITDVSAIYNSIPPVNIKTILFNNNNSILFSTSPLSNINTVYAISATDSGNIVVSGNSGIYYSSDYGKTFTTSSVSGINFFCVSINNKGIGLACTPSILYSSSDYGKTWAVVSSSPPLTGGYYFRQVQVTQTGYSYVVISQNTGTPSAQGGAFKIYYSTDNYNTNNAIVPGSTFTSYTANFWYISFSSPGYGFICDYYWGDRRYFNGSTWSIVSFSGGRSMIGISDNGKYFVAPNFTGNVISYGTIADNGTLGTLQTYTASVTLSGIEGYCSVANNGNCLFGNVNDGFFYLFYYNPLNVVKLPYNYAIADTNVNGGKKYGFYSWGLSPAGDYYYLTPSTGTSKIIIQSLDLFIPFSKNGLPLTTNATYYSISATDYGEIVIATSIGIYYSSNCGNTFTRSNITTSCTSISMNNSGKALASNANTIYDSSDYGVTWSVANSTISTNIKQVVVTQTGLSYILTTTTFIYSSTDYFKTNNTLINSTSYGGIYNMNFASNGNGAICGNAFTMYYSASSNTWISGNIGNGLGTGISDNGNYIAGLSIDAALLLANLAPSNAIDISKFVSYSARSITMNNGGLVSIGNNGVTYFAGNNGPTYNGTWVIYKFKNGSFTNTGYGNVNGYIPISPSGNFLVTISSNNLIILAP